MGAFAATLREIPVREVVEGCAVCAAYKGNLPGWDAEDADALRVLVESETGYKVIGARIKGSGVSADAIRLHRREKHG